MAFFSGAAAAAAAEAKRPAGAGAMGQHRASEVGSGRALERARARRAGVVELTKGLAIRNADRWSHLNAVIHVQPCRNQVRKTLLCRIDSKHRMCLQLVYRSWRRRSDRPCPTCLSLVTLKKERERERERRLRSNEFSVHASPSPFRSQFS